MNTSPAYSAKAMSSSVPGLDSNSEAASRAERTPRRGMYGPNGWMPAPMVPVSCVWAMPQIIRLAPGQLDNETYYRLAGMS